MSLHGNDKNTYLYTRAPPHTTMIGGKGGDAEYICGLNLKIGHDTHNLIILYIYGLS